MSRRRQDDFGEDDEGQELEEGQEEYDGAEGDDEAGAAAAAQQQTIPPLGRYEGQRDGDGRRSGQARMLFANSDTYEGGYARGVRSGRGRYTFTATGAVYDGDFAGGRRQGVGTYTAGASKFDGQWKAGLRDGRGKQVYASGDVYDGGWCADVRSGRGQYTCAGTGVVTDGVWQDGDVYGDAKVVWPDGTVFCGRFERGRPLGRGTFYSAAGVAQAGSFDADGTFVVEPDEDLAEAMELECPRAGPKLPEMPKLPAGKSPGAADDVRDSQMSEKLQPNGIAPRDGPVVVIILDGFGVDKPGPGNAVHLADMKYYNSLVAQAKERNLYTLIKAHGPAVGLPTDGDMGNSEVGHNALGCGQVYSQGTALVADSLASGEFFKTPNWLETITPVAASGKTLHMFGLLSDGNVHSHTDQVYQILDGAAAAGVKHIRVHPLLDGRDVAPDSGLKYIDALEEKLAALRAKGVDALIATGGGRMYMTMDRYESDWPMVKRGWDAMVRGIVAPEDITAEYPGYFKNSREAIELARKLFPKKLDQFNPPWVIVSEDGKPVGRMQDGDAVINWNFRGDRAIEISKAFAQDDFTAFDRVERPAVHYSGMMEYDTEWHIPPKFLVPPPAIKHISSQYLCDAGVRSYALAETHKFGHMTFFWNGNRSGLINPELEVYEEVTSLPNSETESHPEMKAREVTDKFKEALASKKYQYLRVNYANPDMVGHTGNLQSCIESLHVMDKILEEVIPAIAEVKGVALILADHGNIEQMIDKAGSVMTSHTTNPVNFIIVDTSYKGDYVVNTTGIDKPGLTNVTATFINLLGFKEPSMYAKSLIKFH